MLSTQALQPLATVERYVSGVVLPGCPAQICMYISLVALRLNAYAVNHVLLG